MGRPVKVPDGLYEQLRVQAEKHGLSMMDALSQHLEASQRSIAAYAAQAEGANGALAEMRARHADAKRGVASAKRENQELRDRIEGLQGLLSMAQARQDELQAVNREWRDHAEGLEERLDQTRKAAETLRRTSNNRVSGAWLFAWVGILFVTWLAYRQTRDEPDVQAGSNDLQNYVLPW